MTFRRLLITIAVLVAAEFAVAAEDYPLVELTVGEKIYTGKILVKDKDSCWLMAPDGRLDQVKIQEIDDFRRLEKPFQPMRVVDLRNDLLRKVDKSLEVKATRYYVVCAPKGKAEAYGRLFDDVYRRFKLYFSTRGFDLSEPEFPMVAIVYPDHKSFAAHCRKDKISASRGLVGYYLNTTNFVALFDPGESALTSISEQSAWEFAGHSLDRFFASPDRMELLPRMLLTDKSEHAFRRGAGTIGADLKDTIVHEATHQIAFNTGLHNRIGEDPTWVVEGLATVFESSEIQGNSRSRSTKSRLNRERFIRFINFSQSRREEKSLEKFLSSDSMFRASVLDAYSQAWALTFFLIETRSRKYIAYLNAVASRNPLKPYTAKQRVADFKKAFGEDIDWLEIEFVRYMHKMK